MLHQRVDIKGHWRTAGINLSIELKRNQERNRRQKKRRAQVCSPEHESRDIYSTCDARCCHTEDPKRSRKRQKRLIIEERKIEKAIGDNELRVQMVF
ncbi:hypothetical protein IRJ41_003869 [Triplophysa rosa]|uniref:Uncharacterized protein n=1 Tax=Triplophysa rosa TaxID=992332 RepID=A0A9W7WLP1_TRIRA|nr:hypothetical protein IRJ41_003869 [Triplophysa rosa]